MVRKLKSLVASCCFLLCVTSMYAVDVYVSDIYKKIDEAFYNHSSNELNGILSRNANDRNYYLMENYTEKKIRRCIIKEDFDFAMDAIEVVIDNNLENENAVEMYNVIYESYERQQKIAAERAEEMKLEKERIEMAKENKRESVDKEYISASTSTGGAVYVSGKESKSSSSKWKGALGLVDLMLLTEPERKINSFHYGISLNFDYVYLGSTFNFGVDANAAFNFMGFADDPKKLVPLIGEFEVLPKLSFNPLNNLFIRTGFGALLTAKSDTATLTDKVSEPLFTPILGVGLSQLDLGPVQVDLGVDWYAGHLFATNKNLKFAMGVDGNLEIPFAKFETTELNFNIGIKDRFFVKNTGIENRGSIIFAIGVENVIK